MLTVLDVMKLAREKIATPERWGKGTRGSKAYHDRPLTTCCAAEAIEDSCPVDMDLRLGAYAALKKAAGIDQRGVTFTILDWNDAPERTHAEVLAGFDKAISALSSAHSTDPNKGE